MKNNWQTKKLSEVCERITDGTHQTPKYFNDGFIFLSSKNVTSGKIDWENIKHIDDKQHLEMQKRVAPRMNDILLAKNGTTGVAAIVNKNIPFDIYVSLALLRPKEEILPEYLLYFINSPQAKEQFNKRLKGIGVPNLHLEEIREVLFSFPKSHDEQKRIVKILNEAFGKIEKAKENVEKNLQNSNALFYSTVRSIFSNPNKNWGEKRFDEVCILQRGFDLPTRLRTQGKYPLVSSNGISDRINAWKVKAPGVVTGRSGTIGNVHFVEEDFWPLNTALFIKDFHGNYEKCVYYFLKQFDLNRYSSGAGVPTLNRNSVHGEKVWFPNDLKEQINIVNELDELVDHTKKIEKLYNQKLIDLEELKKSILQKAFSGEL